MTALLLGTSPWSSTPYKTDDSTPSNCICFPTFIRWSYNSSHSPTNLNQPPTMYFPSSIKLAGAMLLSAIAANAAPSLLMTTVVMELVDSYNTPVWSNKDGVYFRYVDPNAADAQYNPEPSEYALYKVEDWTDDSGRAIEPVFALTKHRDGSEIDESELSQDIEVLKAGFSEERYWVVWQSSA